MKTSPLRFAVLALLALPLGAQAQPPAGGAPPFAGKKSMTTEEALKQAPKDDPDLAPLAKAFDAAAAKLKKEPKKPEVKKAYVDAGYKYAHTLMTLPQGKLTPPVQYRAALALYRKVLAVDPKHAPSLAEKKQIDDIYAGMPGGIPK